MNEDGFPAHDNRPESVSAVHLPPLRPSTPAFPPALPFSPRIARALQEMPFNAMTCSSPSQPEFLTVTSLFPHCSQEEKNCPFFFLQRFDPEGCLWLRGGTILLVFLAWLLSFSVTSDTTQTHTTCLLLHTLTQVGFLSLGVKVSSLMELEDGSGIAQGQSVAVL